MPAATGGERIARPWVVAFANVRSALAGPCATVHTDGGKQRDNHPELLGERADTGGKQLVDT